MRPAMYQTLVEDLFDRLDRDEVLSMLFKLYPGQSKNYDDLCRVWDVVTVLEPDEADMMVEVTVKASEADVHGFGVDPITGLVKDDESYAIEFMRWEEWFAMPVKLGAGAGEMGDVETLAHILHEMTWHGYTQGIIAAVADDVVKKGERVIEGTPEEDDDG